MSENVEAYGLLGGRVLWPVYELMVSNATVGSSLCALFDTMLCGGMMKVTQFPTPSGRHDPQPIAMLEPRVKSAGSRRGLVHTIAAQMKGQRKLATRTPSALTVGHHN